MFERLMELIRCPACLNSLRIHFFEGTASRSLVAAGILTCDCGAKYPVWKGVPRMLVPPDRTISREYLDKFEDPLRRLGPEFFQEEAKKRKYSFDMQWSMYEYSDLTWEIDIATRVKWFYDEYFRIPSGGLGEALVLDAGCGNGTLTAALAASGPEGVGRDS